MKFLLDINTLIALAHANHAGHDRAEKWFQAQQGAEFYFCSLLEMGYVRVCLQARLEPSVRWAVAHLALLKSALNARNLADDLTAEDLPTYVRAPKQVTDGHFLALARRHGMQFVTFDSGIPGAHLVE